MTVDYGLAASCTDDLYAGREATGVRIVIEAIYRRLTTARGSVIDAPADGLDIRSFLQDEDTSENLAIIPALIRQEVGKDDRVDPATVEVVAAMDGDELDVTITGTTTTQRDSFELVLEVSELTVTLLEGGST